jgi:hypothetical protein
VKRWAVSVAGLLAVLGVVWCLLPNPLCTEEQKLVGTWHTHVTPKTPDGAPSYSVVLVFRSGRSFSLQHFDDVTGRPITDLVAGRWEAGGGRVITDSETSALARLFRTVPPWLAQHAGYPHRLPGRYTIEENTREELVLQMPSGKRLVFGRAGPGGS